MKPAPLASLGLALLLAACDKGSQSSEAQRLADERAALDRDRAALAAEKTAAQTAANEQERARLDAERANLEREKARLSGDREAAAAADQEAKLAAERAKRMDAERQAADATASRREAEIRAEEARAAADAAEQSRGAQTVNFFYDALDPYGDWVDTDRYGYAFHPDAARDPRWRPYTDGGWVYTDYGWTWRSNEPFGWATYHYGRWARVPRLGWVWIPGTEWGPAWVSWRNSDEYVGWAPLPPDAYSSSGFSASVDSYFDIGPGLYTFLRVTDFGEPSYVGRVLEPERNITIINQTVNVTNVTYQNVQNNVVVVNRGPELTVINQHARHPVPRLTVNRVTGVSPKASQVQGNVLQVVTPNLKAPVTVTKPKKVSASVKAAEMEHGWTGGDAETAKFKATTSQEARRAEAAQGRPQPAAPDRSERPAKPLPPTQPIPSNLPPLRATPHAPLTTPVQRPISITPLPATVPPPPPPPPLGREKQPRKVPPSVAVPPALTKETPEPLQIPPSMPRKGQKGPPLQGFRPGQPTPLPTPEERKR